MSIVNRCLGALVDAALYPFHRLDPLVGLAIVSLLFAVGMLLVVKRTSNQKGIEEAKRKLQACVFEIRLYNDDLRAILRAQLELLRHNLTYLRLSAVPMLWALPVLALLWSHLDFRYGYRGLKVGETALVKAELKDGWGGQAPAGAGGSRPALELEAPPGLTVDSPAVWIPSRNLMAWRIAARELGDFAVNVKMGGAVYPKTVRVTDQVERLSPVRPDSRFLDQLVYATEPPLPGTSPLKAISLGYPERDVRVLGWDLPWWLVFFILSLVFAFALKDRFGVTM